MTYARFGIELRKSGRISRSVPKIALISRAVTPGFCDFGWSCATSIDFHETEIVFRKSISLALLRSVALVHRLLRSICFCGCLLLNAMAVQAERYTIPLLVPATTTGAPQGMVRIVNGTDESGEVRIFAINDAGARTGPATFTLNASAAVQFTATFLQSLGLTEGIGVDAGDARLEIETDLVIVPLAFVRGADGALSAMHDTVRAASVAGPDGYTYEVPTFNPASEVTQLSRVRLINLGDTAGTVTISGRDDTGAAAAGGEVRLTLPAGGARTLSAQQLEAGDDSIEGRLGAGVGRWRLSVTSSQQIEIVNLAVTSTGHWSNLSTIGARSLPLFVAAMEQMAPQGVLRVVNAGEESGAVSIYAIDDAGTWSGPATFMLGAGAAAEFDAGDLANGNPEMGLSGGIGAGAEERRLWIDTNLPVELQAFRRAADGTLAVMHDRVRAASGDEAGVLRYEVPIFFPSVNVAQASRLRLINPGGAAAEVTISARDDTGTPASGGEVLLTLPSGAARTLTAWQLETGDSSFEGRLGAGYDNWRLSVSSDRPIEVVNVAVASAGHWRNLSTIAKGETDERAVLVALYNATDGANWRSKANWLSDAPIGQWFGVSVDSDGRVISLELAGNGLSGPIPPELGGLVNLQVLNLQNNRLSGPIPSELGKLANLQVLDLFNNRLSGPIPAELSGLANLHTLLLSNNQLSGSIPAELGELANLHTLFLSNNRLSGSIPVELGGLATLSTLVLSNNQLSGSIPVELGELTYLRFLRLDDNRLSGCIPGEWQFLNNDFSALGLAFCDDTLGPELVMQPPLVSNGSPGIGESFKLSVTVSNQGTHASAATTLRYYRSQDATTSSTDAELGTESVSGLAASREHGVWIGLTAPSSAGRYYYWACVDAVPDEIDSGNNCSVEVAVTVGDDGGESAVDRAILVAFYNATGGRSWRNRANWLSDEPIGEWHGVRTDSSGRVISLELPRNVMWGLIPPELGGLAKLESLNVSGNFLAGPIPAEMGWLENLRELDLYNNRLSGPIPAEMGWLENLRELDLYNNRLSGPIPAELGQLTNLVYLRLAFNRFTGPIPAELGGLASLTHLDLANNRLTGSIPVELGGLGSLRELDIYNNRLTGPIPAQLGHLTDLIHLRLAANRLTGSIPARLGQLDLGSVYFDDNPLAGCIPSEWRDSTSNDFSTLGLPFCNEFEVGSALPGVPASGSFSPETVSGASVSSGSGGTTIDFEDGGYIQLGDGTRYTCVGVGGCHVVNGAVVRGIIVSGVPSTDEPTADMVTDRAALVALYNATGGPNWTNSENWLSDAPISQWYGVHVAGNGRVAALSLTYNELNGSIPPELGDLVNLRSLVLEGNGLRGPIPPELGNLSDLSLLNLQYNGFSGSIPPELGDLLNLRSMILARNRLGGPIPSELANLSNLTILNLQDNGLSGSIPPELGNLLNLESMALDDNRLSGAIPPELGNLSKLRVLSLSDNNLSGSIPPEFGHLANLQRLILSGNYLTGSIPWPLWDRISRGELAQTYIGEILAGNQLVGAGPRSPAERHEEFSNNPADNGNATHHSVSYYQGPLMWEWNWKDEPVEYQRPLLGRWATLAVRIDHEVPAPPLVATRVLDSGDTVLVERLSEAATPVTEAIAEGKWRTVYVYELPGELFQAGNQVVHIIDPDNDLAETDENDNIGTPIRLYGEPPPRFRITFIPLVAHADDSLTPDPERLMAGIRAYFPVGDDFEAKLGPPLKSNAADMHELIDELWALWNAQAFGDEFYHGVINSRSANAGWFQFGGLAALRGRVGLSQISLESITHEIGHNLGLLHPPGCFAPLPRDEDFPYPNGGLGPHSGWDLIWRREVSQNKEEFSDLMCYGGKEKFVSDYHYRKAVEYWLGTVGTTGGIGTVPHVGGVSLGGQGPSSQSIASTSSPPMESTGALALSGRIDATGTWSLTHAQRSKMGPRPPAPDGEFTLILFDDDGLELYREPLTRVFLSQGLHSGWAARTPIPEPAARQLVILDSEGTTVLRANLRF